MSSDLYFTWYQNVLESFLYYSPFSTSYITRVECYLNKITNVFLDFVRKVRQPHKQRCGWSMTKPSPFYRFVDFFHVWTPWWKDMKRGLGSWVTSYQMNEKGNHVIYYFPWYFVKWNLVYIVLWWWPSFTAVLAVVLGSLLDHKFVSRDAPWSEDWGTNKKTQNKMYAQPMVEKNDKGTIILCHPIPCRSISHNSWDTSLCYRRLHVSGALCVEDTSCHLLTKISVWPHNFSNLIRDLYRLKIFRTFIIIQSLY